MPVFISYQHADRDEAILINQFLKECDIECYLDVLDVESRTASSEEITNIITENVKKSTHLIAVTSKNTDASWWVPFEIGEATIVDCRIATYRKEETTLPEYLEQWPAMKNRRDLVKFVEAYRVDETTLMFESRTGNEKYVSNNTANDFHQSLKRKLRGY